MTRKKKKAPPKKSSGILTAWSNPNPAPLEKFPEYAELIGCIVTQWSAIEFMMTWLVGFAMSEHGAIIRPMVYAVASSRSRLAMMEAALRIVVVSPPSDTTLDEIFTEAEMLLEKRNDFAHSFFTSQGDETLVMMKLKYLGMNHPQAVRPLKVEELTDTLDRMKRLHVALAGLSGMMLGFPRPPTFVGTVDAPGALAERTPDQSGLPRATPPRPSES